MSVRRRGRRRCRQSSLVSNCVMLARWMVPKMLFLKTIVSLCQRPSGPYMCFSLVLMCFCQPRKAFAWVLRRFLQIMSFSLVLIGFATT